MTVRRNHRGKWAVDVVFEHPDGRRQRVRKVSPVQSKRGAEQYEREVRLALLKGTFGRKETGPVPTMEEFKPRFIRDWCEANQQKPSGIESKQSAFRNYLLPAFGSRRLDSFSPGDEDRLKRRMVKFSPATYNNAASTLNMVLKAAARWKLIEHVPHRFQLLKRDKTRPKFYDFDQYDWLVESAGKLDPRTELLVLLGGDAGLRRGEIIALEWPDCDLRRGQLTIERSEWQGQVTATKGMRYRVIPMTQRLKRALHEHRHLIGERVLYTVPFRQICMSGVRLPT